MKLPKQSHQPSVGIFHAKKQNRQADQEEYDRESFSDALPQMPRQLAFRRERTVLTKYARHDLGGIGSDAIDGHLHAIARVVSRTDVGKRMRALEIFSGDIEDLVPRSQSGFFRRTIRLSFRHNLAMFLWNVFCVIAQFH